MSESKSKQAETKSDDAVEPTRPYEVGYGKPPTDHQFKPGQSGNPRGRARAPGYFPLSLVRALKEPVRVTKGAAQKSMPKQEAALRMLIEKSLQGDWTAFTALIKKAFKLGLITRVQLPNYNSGVVTLPFAYWHEKKAAQPEAVRRELARRNALWAKGLPYDG